MKVYPLIYLFGVFSTQSSVVFDYSFHCLMKYPKEKTLIIIQLMICFGPCESLGFVYIDFFGGGDSVNDGTTP